MGRAARQWIPNVSRIATAQRRMVNDLTFGIGTAGSWARINAFLIEAGAIRRAFAVRNAFGPTFDVRVSVILGDASARPDLITFLTDSIDSAGSRVARMNWLIFLIQFRREKSITIPKDTIFSSKLGRFLLRITGEQPTNGSPVKPLKQLQIGR